MRERGGARSRQAGAPPPRAPLDLARVLGLAVAVVALCVARSARAQDAPEPAAAEVLFREARRLLLAGEIAPACSKFAESQRLDPRLGTLLNLASCHEQQGKTASAWAEFQEAIGLAVKAENEARTDFARSHAADLERRLSRVLFKFSSPADGLRIRLGDKALAAAALRSPLPLDPGKYLVEVSAPGKEGWATEVTVPPGPATVEVAIPALAHGPPSHPGPSRGDGASTRRVAGLLAGGAGVVGLGVGAYFGVRAFSKQGVVDDHCHGALCDATGLDADDDAHTSAAVSTIAFVAGAALAAGGAVLFFTAGDFPAGRAAGAGVWLAPRVGSLGADLRLGGAW